GQIVWNEIADSSVDPHTLKLPAPALQIVAANSKDGVIGKGQLTVKKAWARATPGGAIVGAGYLEIVNLTTTDDTLLTISSPIAKRVELHKMFEDKGVMNMRPLPDGLVIPAGKSVELKPGGFHLMFLDLKSPLKEGQKFNVELTFAKSGRISVTFDVGEIGAKEGPIDHSHHH
ncbi:MAG: copper chaperone PCu(A)C, partial [Hyphomicrobium sp.]